MKNNNIKYTESKVDELIDSNKYKSLKLYRKGSSIYTNKYRNDYVNYCDVCSQDEEERFVCSFNKDNFTFGLIDTFITHDECYNWDEELESVETELNVEFLTKEEMTLFLKFELDLLNTLVSSKPKVNKDLSTKKGKFDTEFDTNTKYTVYYDNDVFMQYYLDDYDGNHRWYLRLLSGANIYWEGFEWFPTFDDDYGEYDEYDDYYDDDVEYEPAHIENYKIIDLKTAKDIVYTLLNIINKLK